MAHIYKENAEKLAISFNTVLFIQQKHFHQTRHQKHIRTWYIYCYKGDTSEKTNAIETKHINTKKGA